MRKCELLPEHDLKHLCEYVTEIMLEESTVQPVQSPVTICGDLHGQFPDLLELFRNGGECPYTSYIFMVSARAARRRAVAEPLAAACAADEASPRFVRFHSRRSSLPSPRRAGRFRRPWLQQRGDDDDAAAAQGALSAPDHAAAW